MMKKIYDLIKETGTPAFVFNEKEFKDRLTAIDNILNKDRDSEKRIEICYAAKANPFLLTAAAEVADKLEICSQGEMDIVDSLSINPEMVLYSGVSKTASDVRKAIAQGMRHATAESLTHLDILQDEAKKAGVQLTVLLRLNSGAQFGMVRDDIEKALQEKEKYDALEIVGIHYFKGTQRKKIKKHVEELEMLRQLFAELREKYDMELPKLEYGPGLSVPYFEGEDFSDTLLPIKELAEALIAATKWAEVTVEMGRFFAAFCGTYYTAVTDLKDTEDAHVAILDGGIHQLTYVGQMMGMKVPKICHLQEDEREGKKNYMLCGSLCTTGDVLVRDVELSTLQLGDVLVFENVGAYTVTEGIGLFLSHLLPAIYIYNEEREEEQMVLARGPVPTSELNSVQSK